MSFFFPLLATLEMCLGFLQTQEVGKAFECFLEELDGLPKGQVSEMWEMEQPIYDKALAMYLQENDPQKLLKEFEGVALGHPEYCYLNLLVSTAYANLGELEKFFVHFYKNYEGLQETFLAEKVKGILLMKLAVGEVQEKKREEWKRRGVEALEQALMQNSNDLSVYKILISEGPNKEFYFEKMIGAKVVPHRLDLTFYVEQLMALKRLDLAEELLNNAKDVYTYSRQIQACENILKTR